MKRSRMRQIIAALAVTFAVTGASLAIFLAAVAVPAGATEPVPHCQRVLITTPWRSFTVKACDSGLRQPAPGKQWQWTVDGSALRGGAVIFGYQIPKQG